MQLKLKVLEGSRVGTEVPVPGPKFIIGRDEDCQLRPRSDLISRHHCVLLVEQGYIAVRDFGSKNGTFVNDQRIAGEQPLKAGDTLSVGPLRFEVLIHHGVGGPKRPKVKDVKEAASRGVALAGQGELEISDWLSEDDALRAGAVLESDASRVKLGDEISTGETSEMSLEAATDVTRQCEEPTRISKDSLPVPTQSPTQREPGEPADASTIRVPPKPKAKDTQSAAMDVLRKFRQQQQQQQQPPPKK